MARSSKTSSNKLKLCILNSIKLSGKLPATISKPKIAYHLKPFLKANIVEKRGYGVWGLTAFGEQYLNTNKFKLNAESNLDTLVKPTSKKLKNIKEVRGHGFMFRLELPKIPSWHKKLDILKYKKYNPETTKQGVVRIKVRGNNVHLAQSSIVVYFNPSFSFIATSANESFKEALFEMCGIVRTLENTLGVSLRIGKKHKIRCRKQHYAFIKNEIAQEYIRNNKRLSISQNGKEWLLIDFSHKVPELECVDADRAKVDADYVVHPFLNKIRDNPLILTTHSDSIEALRLENTKLREEVLELNKDVNEILKYIKRSASSFSDYKY